MTSQRSAHITPRSKQKIFYSDFTIDFEADLVTGALQVVKNEKSVKESLKNIILTQRGERFYDPEFGSDVKKSLFNPFDELTMSQLSESITTAINKHEPRADHVKVHITQYIEDNTYKVDIQFIVINIPNVPQSMEVIVNRVR
jgi:phage baseplate assembly protein W